MATKCEKKAVELRTMATQFENQSNKLSTEMLHKPAKENPAKKKTVSEMFKSLKRTF